MQQWPQKRGPGTYWGGGYFIKWTRNVHIKKKALEGKVSEDPGWEAIQRFDSFHSYPNKRWCGGISWARLPTEWFPHVFWLWGGGLVQIRAGGGSGTPIWKRKEGPPPTVAKVNHFCPSAKRIPPPNESHILGIGHFGSKVENWDLLGAFCWIWRSVFRIHSNHSQGGRIFVQGF